MARFEYPTRPVRDFDSVKRPVLNTPLDQCRPVWDFDSVQRPILNTPLDRSEISTVYKDAFPMFTVSMYHYMFWMSHWTVSLHVRSECPTGQFQYMHVLNVPLDSLSTCTFWMSHWTVSLHVRSECPTGQSQYMHVLNVPLDSLSTCTSKVLREDRRVVDRRHTSNIGSSNRDLNSQQR